LLVITEVKPVLLQQQTWAAVPLIIVLR